MIQEIFKLRPSLPKYITTYDPDIILRYIDSLSYNKFLLLGLLTKKLCLLMCLLSGQLEQSLKALKLSKSTYQMLYTHFILIKF